MSLDVYLILLEPRTTQPRQAIFVRRDGANVEITREEWNALRPGVEPVMATINMDDAEATEVYSANITHNLGEMAEAAGLYRCLWRPEEIGITQAAELVGMLEQGLIALKAEPARFRTFNPPNGWGSYEGLVSFVERYLMACRDEPGATVSVSR